MKKVIIDTNFFTIPYQFRIDIFEEIHQKIPEEHELITLSGVIRELENLAENKGRDSIAAKVGLELIEKKGIEILQSQGNVDDAIVGLADKQKVVATNDKDLIKRLKDKNVKILYLRGKNHLELR
jgi:hypothetical protein